MDKNINQLLAEALIEVRDVFKKHLNGKLLSKDAKQVNNAFGLLNDLSSRLRAESERPAEAPASSSGHTEASLDEMLQYYFPDDYYEVQRKKTIPLINRYVDGKLSQLSKELQEARAALQSILDRSNDNGTIARICKAALSTNLKDR